MLSKADFPIADAERLLAPLGVSATYLAPTTTALHKSIIDATEGVRTCLRRAGVHDFDTQSKGEHHKRVVDSELYSGGSHRRVRMSLYRPETKDGDPRLWISQLRDHVRPHNLLAVIPTGNCVVVLNISDPTTREDLERRDSELCKRLASVTSGAQESFGEVLDALRDIASKGWVKAFRHGSTAVGMTLERELGIAPNSDQAPDFRGFEVKAKCIDSDRPEEGHSTTRHTLFAKVPDWDISAAKSSKEILTRHGYSDGTSTSRRRLYCTVSAKAPNSQGLQFRVDESAGHLVEFFTHKSGSTHETARWRRKSLEEKLDEKHRQTAWVFAKSRGAGPTLEFRFTHVKFTSKPRTAALMNLLQGGVITMDHLIKEAVKGTVTEKGPLFKVHPLDLGLLFRSVQAADLHP